ncbi:MAG: anthranilate phosphoribosyltransferase [Bacteroidota bacterium]
MKEILEYLFANNTLSRSEARFFLKKIASGKYNRSQVCSFLTIYNMRSITVDELSGFRDALLDLAIHATGLNDYSPMDLCGTGGDGKNTFNISTLSSFVVAGAGIPVAKHGNYGVSSTAGSSDILDYFSFRFTSDGSILSTQMEKANICFLHAPLFHPAMRNIADIRKELGVKTFFNMLGPLVNPSRPYAQLTGVFSPELAYLYESIFNEDKVNYAIVHSMDGSDEISLTGDCMIITHEGVRKISAEYFGFSPVKYKEITGGRNVREAAGIFYNIISGKGTESRNNVVLANAAIAIQAYHRQVPLTDCIEMAKESLFGLKALQSFNMLKQMS